MRKKNLPDRLDELLTEVLNRDPLVLASISTAPFFGGTLATFLSAKWLQIYQERTKSLFDKFGEDLNELDERTIKQEYFDTPEGIDLLIKAMEQSTRTRSEEKRSLIARILASATSTDVAQEDYTAEEYLNLVESLTEKELQVARTIYDLQKGRDYRNLEVSEEGWKIWQSHRKRIIEEHSLDEDDLPIILDRIATTGLVTLVLIQFPGSPGRTYWATPSFDKLLRFLRLDT